MDRIRIAHDLGDQLLLGGNISFISAGRDMFLYVDLFIWKITYHIDSTVSSRGKVWSDSRVIPFYVSLLSLLLLTVQFLYRERRQNGQTQVEYYPSRIVVNRFA